jgi:hypothetical protein
LELTGGEPFAGRQGGGLEDPLVGQTEHHREGHETAVTFMQL